MAEEQCYLISAEQSITHTGSHTGPVWVLVTPPTITSVTTERPDVPTTTKTFTAKLLVPGFVDIHTHGLGGHDDILYSWTNPGHSQRLLAKSGTTACLASIVFPPDPDGTQVSALIGPVMQRVGQLGHGAVIEGIHAEGPVVQDLGALVEGDRGMSDDAFTAFVARMSPHLKVMTISPSQESSNKCSRIRILAELGCLVSLGHDRSCSEEDILQAMHTVHECGARCHITHLFNVCGFHHRNPSLVNFGLVDRLPNLPRYGHMLPPTVEVICDLAHVHPMAIQTLVSARSHEDIVCITDNVLESTPGTKATYCGRHLEVSPDGKAVVLEGTSTLAGSCMSQLDSFRNLVNVLGVPVPEAANMLAANPCRIVGLNHLGRIEAGCRADFLFLTEAPALRLEQTVIGGVFTD